MRRKGGRAAPLGLDGDPLAWEIQVMKRLLVLVTLGLLLGSAAGCNCWERWFRRGDACAPVMYGNPCAPACNPCDSCTTGAVPGPESYVPATP